MIQKVIYELELQVYRIFRRNWMDDAVPGTSIVTTVQICDHPKWTECNVPFSRFVRIEFTLPVEENFRKTCDPRPVRVAVRLYRMTDRGRVELGSGELTEMAIRKPNRSALGSYHEVLLTDRPGGRTVAEMSVRARVRVTDRMTTKPVAPVNIDHCNNRTFMKIRSQGRTNFSVKTDH